LEVGQTERLEHLEPARADPLGMLDVVGGPVLGPGRAGKAPGPTCGSQFAGAVDGDKSIAQ